ncbi:hypothetical protein [uncultured Gammaproteobacteria bacterium]|nr:hypothetical protein [uncultured Gammaproteobacteria bacterium]
MHQNQILRMLYEYQNGRHICQVSPRCSLSPKITLRNISGSLINKSGFKLYQYSKAS